ncbi:DUF393 domain-containing protein [Streptomyces rubradiris]|uniref:DUF393 domain-containing protein n=1 Tax=Streptomyces rubradiris TaxID=285531 RepID=A0ABQ3RIT5_STRRR|nr:DUF393 domain-containing protein [Streptomyces rubradiris]GHH07513.1 hypothetical protein GCM10018792_28090 [Streptomyces rubradiris]GHI55778.1 hypothetical protein Srubr_56240 [Streptomyces rubradiris]
MTGVTTTTTAPDRDPAGAPVRGLTVLYDDRTAVGLHLRDWLARRPRLVPLEPLPAGSAAARARFPGLGPGDPLDEITLVGDSGQVYRGPSAWIVLLWALREHRPLAHRLAGPAGAAAARDAVLTAAKWRGPRRPGTPWGGRVHQRADGWSYHPLTGWTYAPPSRAGAAPASR